MVCSFLYWCETFTFFSPKQNRLSTRDRFCYNNTKFLPYPFSAGLRYFRDRYVSCPVWFTWLMGTEMGRAVTWATRVPLRLGTMTSVFGANCRAVLRSIQSRRNVLAASYTWVVATRTLHIWPHKCKRRWEIQFVTFFENNKNEEFKHLHCYWEHRASFSTLSTCLGLSGPVPGSLRNFGYKLTVNLLQFMATCNKIIVGTASNKWVPYPMCTSEAFLSSKGFIHSLEI